MADGEVRLRRSSQGDLSQRLSVDDPKMQRVSAEVRKQSVVAVRKTFCLQKMWSVMQQVSDHADVLDTRVLLGDTHRFHMMLAIYSWATNGYS
jgi:DNA-binding transcriptional regulator LsrR (DeoR family)